MALKGSWTLAAADDGFYGLKQSGLFLSNKLVPAGDTVVLGAVTDMTDAGQRWFSQLVGNGLFRIVNRADGSMLSRRPSGCVALKPDAGDASQQWLVSSTSK